MQLSWSTVASAFTNIVPHRVTAIRSPPLPVPICIILMRIGRRRHQMVRFFFKKNRLAYRPGYHEIEAEYYERKKNKDLKLNLSRKKKQEKTNETFSVAYAKLKLAGFSSSLSSTSYLSRTFENRFSFLNTTASPPLCEDDIATLAFAFRRI